MPIRIRLIKKLSVKGKQPRPSLSLAARAPRARQRRRRSAQSRPTIPRRICPAIAPPVDDAKLYRHLFGGGFLSSMTLTSVLLL
ncbi:hypothetical protein LZ32DRAFT_370221 [Colletotrichum eremochloae]|nr:hypothetical protein LZ32DRAFT_370221 [Colletotrichum eremochloae]